MDRIKFFIGDLFGFNQTINKLKSDNFICETNLNNTKNILNTTQTRVTQLEQEIELLSKQKNNIKPELPSVFYPTTNVYKSGFRIYYKDENGSEKNVWVHEKIGGAHLTLTPIFDKIINASSINSTDSELQVFNKILGWVQRNTKYCYDQNQWGKSQFENWTPAIIVYGTRQDDCESVSALTISAFQYWQLVTNNRTTYSFIGTGLYAKSYGHGFPCLLTGNNLMEDLYIGEATLSIQRDAKKLKDCKNVYWCNWGNHSFWHEFRINKDLEWWNESTATPINGVEKMTGEKIEDFIVKDKKQFKKKKKAIEDFWKEK
jgi:hypothetical protein